ncbi:Uncharacterized protein TCM_021475 [Theobroma cacao]|uniref:Bifunctional inhibitor/plant lipid transfer protein/seed storage helical domain-containing protein n=1 Tax=Theobroma cacao TaxID=3641 RepID=A0A061EX86_THECC|nr:Uncharacterized protein TCM_021475 [Theobroma cacao]
MECSEYLSGLVDAPPGSCCDVAVDISRAKDSDQIEICRCVRMMLPKIGRDDAATLLSQTNDKCGKHCEICIPVLDRAINCSSAFDSCPNY